MSQQTGRRLIARGRVQRVGFRAFVQEMARAFDINGWVRNNPDGSVEICAQGRDETLRSFIEQVEIGPSGARVDELDVREEDVEKWETGFRILRDTER